MRPALARLLVLVVVLNASVFAATKFTSTWKAPEASQVQFTGKKVAVLVMTTDQNLQVSGEEGLARELALRGIQTVAAYRLIPREELRNPEKARGWFERAGVEGIVAMRPVSVETVATYTPTTWSASYYTSLWGYYGYGWGVAYNPGSTRHDSTVLIETLIYSVPMNKLLWAGASETTNPKSAAKLLADVVQAAAKEMQKQGLVKK